LSILIWFPESTQLLFKGFPDDCDALKVLKYGALETGSSARWATEWEEHAKPLITEASSFSYSMRFVIIRSSTLVVVYYLDLSVQLPI